jgi:hypothetical protein
VRPHIPQLILRELSFSGQAMTAGELPNEDGRVIAVGLSIRQTEGAAKGSGATTEFRQSAAPHTVRLEPGSAKMLCGAADQPRGLLPDPSFGPAAARDACHSSQKCLSRMIG